MVVRLVSRCRAAAISRRQISNASPLVSRAIMARAGVGGDVVGDAADGTRATSGPKSTASDRRELPCLLMAILPHLPVRQKTSAGPVWIGTLSRAFAEFAKTPAKNGRLPVQVAGYLSARFAV